MTESDLAAQFVELLPFAHKPLYERMSGPAIAQEFECGEGIADVVLAYVDTDLAQRLTEAWPVLSAPTAAAVAARLRRNAGTSVDEVARSTGVTTATVRSYLTELERVELITPQNEGYALLDSTRTEHATEIWAFELKLRKWQDALAQTLRYKLYAHYTAVVMPAEYSRPALAAEDLFRQFGVGLLSLDREGTLKQLVRPRKSTPRATAVHLSAVGKLVSTYL